MKLNNIWGYGQLFGFSGLDGKNRYYNDFVGTTMRKKIEIRFELKDWIKVCFPVKGRVKFKAVTGDMIEAETKDGAFFLTFADADTLVGYSPVKPVLKSQKKLSYEKSWNVDVWYNKEKAWFNATDCIGIVTREENGVYKFAIHHSHSQSEARSGANYFINSDVEKLKEERYEYYKKLPKCKDKKYEKLYYKALSINKVNVHTAEGKIPCMWTTPDRVPHRHMWLWDSVFHALAMVTYNEELAKDAIRAVLSQQRKDGFIAHMMNPTDDSDVTQPQVLAWGVWEVYKKTGDKAFLEESVEALENYLEWDKENRDKNGNGLLEWFTEPDYTECRCGESGLDNSPRFDTDDDLDGIDISCFQARDSKYLSYIFKELGNEEKAEKWKKEYEKIANTINELLWDEEDGVYYDRLFNGKKNKILTPVSFLPMFAGFASKEQAEKMVVKLTDERELWTKAPLASITQKHPTFSNDMWRGGVWLNHNYFIMKGLQNYGYDDLAEELRVKTLEMVNKWYKKTGSIFEFYDPNNEVAPYLCKRKGIPVNPPDWRKHVHSIMDYNWSACFTILFIQKELY